MQNSQQTAEKIKKIAKERGISVSKLLIECSLNKNALYTMQSGGYYPRMEAMLKIADYLNCSVDYLLGRTDDPTNATLRGFNSLNSEGQSMVMEYIRVLMNDDKYRKVRTAPQQHSLEIAAFGGKGTEGAQPHGAPEITGN